MNPTLLRALVPATIALAVAGCGRSPEANDATKTEASGEDKPASGDAQTAILSAQQISDAGIEVTRPTVGGVAGAIELPATIEGDPQGVQVVSAPIGGRLVVADPKSGSVDPSWRHAGGDREPRGRLAQRRSRSGARACRARRLEPSAASSACSPSGYRPSRISLRLAPLRPKRTSRFASRVSSSPPQAAMEVRSTGLRSTRLYPARSSPGRQRSDRQVAADAELFRVANLAKVSIIDVARSGRRWSGEARRPDRGDVRRSPTGRPRYLRLADPRRDNASRAGHRDHR